MAVLGEFGGDDEGGEDDELGIDGVNVQQLVAAASFVGSWERGRRWQSVALGSGWKSSAGLEGAGEAPGAGELGVEAVEDADGEGDGLERQVGAAEEGLDEGD